MSIPAQQPDAVTPADKLQQIADGIGVSPNTVLRVLRGQNKEVWPSAIRRADAIREMAKELGYLPNASARAMRRGSYNSVALLLSADRGRSYIPDDLFNAVHDALAERDLRLTIAKATDDQLSDRRKLPSLVRDLSCDGLLINYTDHIPSGMAELIERYKLPATWINSRQEADCVYYDDFGGSMRAVEHLVSLGHRRIEYLDFTAIEREPRRPHYSRADRYAGYVQAMKAAKLVPTTRERHAGTSVTERLAATRSLLSSPDRPSAIICYDAPDRVLYAAALEGLSVPRDVSLMTFASRLPREHARGYGEAFIGRNVTSIRVPAERAGAEAVSMLLKKIASPGRPLQSTVVPLELEAGDTTGPASSSDSASSAPG